MTKETFESMEKQVKALGIWKDREEEEEVEAPTSLGLRYDRGKVRFDLIPPEWEMALAQILTDGAEKYAERNWEKGMDWDKMLGCTRRHLIAFQLGQPYDAETGNHHLAMAAWNCLALMSYHVRGMGNNNLPNLNFEWDVNFKTEPLEKYSYAVTPTTDEQEI